MAHFFNLKGFLEEFKAFALKGNVIDLAVAVVIGGAFNKIVSVFVSSIITPIIGYLTSGVNLAYLVLKLGDVELNTVNCSRRPLTSSSSPSPSL